MSACLCLCEYLHPFKNILCIQLLWQLFLLFYKSLTITFKLYGLYAPIVLYSVRVGRTDCTPRNIILKDKKKNKIILQNVRRCVQWYYFVRNVCSGCGVVCRTNTSCCRAISTHGTPVVLFTKCDITPVGLDFGRLRTAMTLHECNDSFLMPYYVFPGQVKRPPKTSTIFYGKILWKQMKHRPGSD